MNKILRIFSAQTTMAAKNTCRYLAGSAAKGAQGVSLDYNGQRNVVRVAKGRMVMMEVDELRYSRLIYSIGKVGVEKLLETKALILGCRGIGAEISKNLILSGIGGVGLVDDGVVSVEDLGSQMLLKEGDVGSNRAVSTVRNLRELNPSADIVAISEAALESSLKDYQIVVATAGSLPHLVHINFLCRAAGIYFIAAFSRGVFSFVFVDFGESFSVLDETGQPEGALLIESITQDSPATITVVEDQRHGLEDSDEVTFHGIIGMEELNQRASYPVTVTGPTSFTIPEDTRGFARYISGGFFQRKKPIKNMGFLPLQNSMAAPEFCVGDPLKSDRAPQLHIAFQAVDEFERQRGITQMGCLEENDIDEVVKIARELWNRSAFASAVSSGSEDEAVATVSDCNRDNGAAALTVEEAEAAVEEEEEEDMRQQASSSPSADVASTSASSSPAVINHIPKRAANGIDEDMVRLVAAQGHFVELCPVVAITGGIAAQEVIKALTRVFMPLHQWLYFDAVECLPPKLGNLEERSPTGSRYDLQSSLFGREFQQRLSSSQWLVVGAGGIGTEVLKNLVMMGVGCNGNGKIIVTDMDSVSKSNLVNQSLYHIDDIDRPKTPTASRALRRINPAVQIHALRERFDSDSENVFDSSFFDSLTGVFSAVDTSSSRLYIDMRCVTYRRPMIDGGKHGAKGSVQVFVPFQSEMYASTRDPPEHKEIPICTLKNFPYATEHTLQWAVELFEALFKQRPIDVNSYLSNREVQESIRKSPPVARLPILETLRDALVLQRPLSFSACVQWARLQFEELFTNSIKQLLFNFPAAMPTAAGAPFWSGTKRVPTPLSFDANEKLHMDFIVAAANLQATVYGLKGCRDPAIFLDILHTVLVPNFEPREGVKIAVSDNEIRNNTQRRSGRLNGDDDEAGAACEAISRELPTPAMLVGYRLSPIEFEKDDECNFHVDFVAAAANLRACNYGIPLTTKLQARLVGGRVIPAIATSTAVIGGLMCLEMYKVLMGKGVSEYRHSYFNLALPLVCSAQPIKAVKHTVVRSERESLRWTLWDRFEMDCRAVNLEKFLSDFKQQQGLDITMVSYGKSLLYAEFLPRKKLEERMKMTLMELVSVVGKVMIPPTETKLTFSVSCTDANDNDVEVPDVVAKIR